MKTKIILIALFSSFSTPAFSFDCQRVSKVHQSERYDCSIPTGETSKNFHVLKLKGTFAEGTYDHAYLMSREASEGLISEVQRRFSQQLSEGSLPQRKLKAAIVDCFTSRMKSSVSKEFMDGVRGFGKGLREGSSAGKKYSQSSVEEIALGIELSIATEGLMRRIEEDPMKVYAELGATCGISITAEGLKTFLELPFKIFTAMKLGCLGMVSPAATSLDQGLIHARNFDGDLVESWNHAPTLFLIEEPGYYKFAAAAGAGMMYPGGVSGFNEKGIAVSLHEMSTHKYRTYHPNQSGVVAPFLQQRILRETKSIDEAIALINRTKHFGGWTILISDAKTNEIASVELSGDRVQVARRVQNKTMSQSNHFVGSQMQDQFFTYNFNKNLESKSRLLSSANFLEQDSGKINVDWMIEHLAGHIDYFEGFRSFGRTATKVYTLMSTIAVPLQNQFWITLGDRLPASHSPFLGFQIDFSNMSFASLGTKRVKAYEAIPSWEKSLTTYGQARQAYERKDAQQSMILLSKAIREASDDGIQELPYHFMRARVTAATSFTPISRRDFDLLWKNRASLHPYQQALVAIYSTHLNDSLAGSAKFLSGAERDFRLHFAKGTLQKLYQETPHFDLQNKLKLVDELQSKKKLSKTPELDFVTLE